MPRASRQQLWAPFKDHPGPGPSGRPGPRSREVRPCVPHQEQDRHPSNQRQCECEQAAASRASRWVVSAVTPCMGPPTAYAAGPSIQRVKSRHSAVSYDGVRYSSLSVGRDAKRCPFGTVVSGLDAPGGSLSSLRPGRFPPSLPSPAVSSSLPAPISPSSTTTKSLPPPARLSRCHRRFRSAFMRRLVQAAERPSSLRSSVSASAASRAYRLGCSLFQPVCRRG